MVVSLLPDARRKPSGDQAAPQTSLVCPCKAMSSFPPLASQSCTVPSRRVESSIRPSGDHTTMLAHPESGWASSNARFFPVWAFHNCTLPRSLLTASVCPSGDQATMLALPTFVCKTERTRPVLALPPTVGRCYLRVSKQYVAHLVTRRLQRRPAPRLLPCLKAPASALSRQPGACRCWHPTDPGFHRCSQQANGFHRATRQRSTACPSALAGRGASLAAWHPRAAPSRPGSPTLAGCRLVTR